MAAAALAPCESPRGRGAATCCPTELKPDRREVAEHKRLACQVKVRQDMRIRAPERYSALKMGMRGGVQHNAASFIKEFVVAASEGETSEFESGGYVQIDAGDRSGFKRLRHHRPPAHDRQDKPDEYRGRVGRIQDLGISR